MPKEKLRLPMYSAVEAYFKTARMNANCFELYAFDEVPNLEKNGDVVDILNVPAHDYLLRGRIAMKRAEMAVDESKRRYFHERAFSSFRMSLEAKPDYLCAFRFLIDVSEKLGLQEMVEEFEYKIGITSDIDHKCPFLDPSYLSAKELAKLVKTAQCNVDAWEGSRKSRFK